MNLFCKRGVQVSRTDNGWVLEWRDEEPRRVDSYHDSNARNVRGIEVYADKAKLMKRIEELI